MPKDLESLCYLELSIICFVRNLINYSIAAIALERLRAILKPLEYRSESSKKFSILILTSFWCFSFIIGFLTMGWKVDGDKCAFSRMHAIPTVICSLVGKIFPYSIVFISYGYIFIKIRKVS